jgi:hypothetical protein
MSPAEIIEQIKQLPPKEREQVREFFAANGERDAAKYADDATLKKAADEVFTKYDDLLRKLAQ